MGDAGPHQTSADHKAGAWYAVNCSSATLVFLRAIVNAMSAKDAQQ